MCADHAQFSPLRDASHETASYRGGVNGVDVRRLDPDFNNVASWPGISRSMTSLHAIYLRGAQGDLKAF